MKYYGVAIEHWSQGILKSVMAWLRDEYGPEGKFVNGETVGLWAKDVDFDLTTLIMREDVYTVYALKWGE